MTADGNRASADITELQFTTVYTNAIGNRPLTVNLHVTKQEKLIVFGVVFGKTDCNAYLWENKRAWCVETGGARYKTILHCRGEQQGENELRIHAGSELKLQIDPANRELQFTVDGLQPFAPVQMDITDSQVKELRVAVTFYGKTTVEIIENN